MRIFFPARETSIFFLAFAILCVGSGCGLLADFGPPRADAGVDGVLVDADRLDADRLDADPLDASGFTPCRGQADGEPCSSGGVALICVREACDASRCGDGFVDVAAGEVCDPGSASDPLCPSCFAECGPSVACPPLPCSSVTCESSRCRYVPNDGVACEGGTCRGGTCVSSLCGNMRVDPDEQCDLGATASAGCIGCRYACNSDEDCDDGDPCNWVETCELIASGRACMPTIPPECPSPEPCYASGCTPFVGCTQTLVGDADGDGYPITACGDFAADCDDGDAFVNPGAVDLCNDIDDDCDGTVDDGLATWCLDGDGDGFGDMRTAQTACLPPGPDFVPNCQDCWDDADPGRRALAALVNPGQRSFFTAPYPAPSCPMGTPCSYDYDCSSAPEQQFRTRLDCGLLGLPRCDVSAGWTGAVPACGRAATFARCQRRLLLCFGANESRVQACR